MMQKKVKVLLIQPNFHYFYIPFLPNHEPLVLIILGSIVQDIAEVRVFDRRYETEGALIKTLKEFKPDIVGTRTHTSGEIFTVKRILEVTKKILPFATTIVGGQHPTLLPEDLNFTYTDLLCIGPGEETFREVVQAKAAGSGFDNIKGLAIRKNGQLYFTQERCIESTAFKWPFLNRDLAKKYRKHFRSGFTVTSVGCPYRCNFCALWVATRGTYRLRDIEGTVEDIASIPQRSVYIGDDNTFHNYEHALGIYEGLKRLGVKKHYLAYARTDAIVRNRELFEKWRQIGLIALIVGFEVTSDEELKEINKKATLEETLNAIKILEELDITSYGHFIVFPHFIKKDFDNLWSFVKKHRMTLSFYVPLTPLAGTPLFKEYKEKKLLACFDYGFYTLEYMVCKTALAKWRFYLEYLKLWFRSLNPFIFFTLKRSFLAAYLVRTILVVPAFFHMLVKIPIQLWKEKFQKYDKIKHNLPPSMQEGYVFKYLENLPKE